MTDIHLATLLDRFVRRMHVELRRNAPQFDTENIGPGGSMILLTLDELGEIPMQTLSRALIRDKSQMTRAINALEKKGMVSRAQAPSDSRVTLIALTDTGHSTVSRLQKAIAEALDTLLAPLPSHKTQQLHDLLATVVEAKARKD